MSTLRLLFRDSRELGLIGAVVLILIVLFAPIPPLALDLALLVNFALSLTILMLTFNVAKPVEFSTFPSLLLLSTLLRLSLNIAATRLILTSGNAGHVIGSIGTFAVGGNFVVGLVVFFILVVVQYVVVTSGAQRVSEVAARFTLDSMPGQQMSIDADLNMGLIDQKEAVRRRAALEKEAAFYGSMDGASKFVKGDAIAGVIILLIDIIAGWIIGMAQMGMGWSEALRHFTLLTIGDGIATQLPALIISTATGIIVTRSSADRQLSTEVFQQLLSAPRIPLIVSLLLVLLLLLPGMPKWPIVLLLGAAWLSWRELRRKAQTSADAAPQSEAESTQTPEMDILSVALGAALADAWRTRQALVLDRVATLRQAQERALGVGFPALGFVDDARLGEHEYEIRLFGSRYASGQIRADRVLAIRGEQTRARLEGAEALDPAFGLPATWITEEETLRAREAGYTIVDPVTVFITHLSEVIRLEGANLLTRGHVSRLLEGVRSRQPGLVEELTPQIVTVSDLQHILQNLLAEGVSIAAIDLIVEHLVDVGRNERDPAVLSELVRQRLGFAICSKLRDRHRELAVLSLDPRLENQIAAMLAASGARRDAGALDPRLAEKLLRKLAAAASDMMRQGREPALLCGPDLRRPMRALTRRSISRLTVLAVNEIPMNIELKCHAIVKIDDDEPQRPAATLGASLGYVGNLSTQGLN